MQSFVAELVGTMILVILGDGVVANVVLARTKGNKGGWIVITTGWATAVALGVYCVGRVSGAHLNPAVTIGLASIGQFEWSQVGSYVAAQMIGAHHQYPDGLMLFLGTMFAPVQDRDAPGQGFTHHPGDVVTIEAPGLGTLVNTVGLATEAPEWSFGAGALMRNLAGRGLI